MQACVHTRNTHLHPHAQSLNLSDKYNYFNF